MSEKPERNPQPGPKPGFSNSQPENPGRVDPALCRAMLANEPRS